MNLYLLERSHQDRLGARLQRNKRDESIQADILISSTLIVLP